MEKEYYIKSPNKVFIKVTGKAITITRKGLVSLANHGLKGDKTIPLKSITSVQIKKPGFTNGYIQFGVLGSVENKGGIFAATQDENTIVFAKKHYEDMLELEEYINSYISGDSSTTVGNTPVEKSPVEKIKELKELLDMEIITQEEFDIKKKELLNI